MSENRRASIIAGKVVYEDDETEELEAPDTDIPVSVPETKKSSERRKKVKPAVKEKQKASPVWYVCMAVCLVTFIYSGFKVYEYFNDNAKSRELYDNLAASVVTVDVRYVASGLQGNLDKDTIQIKPGNPVNVADNNGNTGNASGNQNGEQDKPNISQDQNGENTQGGNHQEESTQTGDTQGDNNGNSGQNSGNSGAGTGSSEVSEEVIEFAPITVNFNALQKINKNVVGWLYSENTVINYPILQSDDNIYYLTHLLDNSTNKNGTLFLDCLNSSMFYDDNSIIYGHNMKTGDMFGTLKNYKKQSYYDEHPVMYLITPERNYKVYLFAGSTMPAVADTYPQQFGDKESFDTYIEKIRSLSTFKSDVEVNYGDKLLTLSTCTSENDNNRYIIFGKMVPIY